MLLFSCFFDFEPLVRFDFVVHFSSIFNRSYLCFWSNQPAKVRLPCVRKGAEFRPDAYRKNKFKALFGVTAYVAGVVHYTELVRRYLTRH
jgi:hypothetical protein